MCTTCIAGCGVDLVVPDAVTVTCNAGGGCPKGLRCSVARQCIPEDDPDEQPRLLQASAIDNTTITLSFSKAMRTDLLAPPTAYHIDHDASVIATDVSLDGTSVRLVTSAQRGRSYTVTVTGATDPLGRPLAADSASFLGIGTPLDTTVPRTISPLAGARLRGPLVDLVWTQNIDSIDYHVEIARDAAMTDVVARLEIDAASTATTVELDTAGQYYWRVTSDASEVPSNIGRFVMLTDAVYVSCLGYQFECSAARDTTRGGDKGEPLTTFGSALNLARSLGIGTVRAMATPNDATFADDISVISQTVSIEGGYDATFSSVVGLSNVFSANGACLVYGAPGVRLSHLGCFGGDIASGGVVRIVGSSDVVLDHVDVGVTAANSQPLSIDESTVRLTSVNVNGSALSLYTTLPSLISASAVTIESSLLSELTLQLVRDSDLLLDHTRFSTISKSGDGTLSQGVVVRDSSHVSIRDSRVFVGEPESGISMSSIALDVSNDASFDIRRSLVFASPSFNVSHCSGTETECRTMSSAILLTQNATGVVENSVLAAGGRGDGAPLYVSSVSANVSVFFSTLIGMRSGTPLRTGDGIVTASNSIDLVDSLLVCEDDVVETLAAAIMPTLPRTMVSNAIACATAFRPTVDDATTDTASIEAFNVDGTRSVENFSIEARLGDMYSNLAGADGVVGTLDDDLETLGGVAAGLAHAGRQTDAATCGPVANAVACPRITDDLSGRPRGDPPSIGPWELP